MVHRRPMHFLALGLGLLLAAGSASAEPRIAKDRIPADARAEVKAQIGRLYSEDPRERSLAVRTLQGMGDAARPAIPFLASMVGDMGETGVASGANGRPTWKVGDLAAQALLSFGDIGSAPFEEAFDDPNVQSRNAAVYAVARLGLPIVPRVVESLSRPSWLVRRCALVALGMIGSGTAAEPVLAALYDEQPEVRVAAARSLGLLGDRRAVEPLIAALWDEDARPEAIVALGNLRDPRAAGPLLECLNANARRGGLTEAGARKVAPAETLVHPATGAMMVVGGRSFGPAQARIDVLTALSKVYAPGALAPLLAAVRPGDAQLRQMAVRALGQLADPGAVAPLVALLDEPDANMRYYAAEALGGIGGPDVVEALIGALHRSENRDQMLASGAVVALGRLRDPKAMAALGDALRRENLAMSAGPALAAYGKEAVPALVAALADTHPQVWQGALAGLSAMGDDGAEALVPLLSHKDGQVRIAVVKSLASMKSPPVDALIVALKDDMSNVRSFAAAGLAKGHDPRAVDPLIEAMRAFPDSSAADAATALGEIGDPKAVPGLIETLGAKADASRRAAAHALGALKDPRAAKPLVDALRQPAPLGSDGRTYQEIAEALVAIGEPAAGPLVEAVGQGSEDFWPRLGEALSRLDNPPVDRILQSLRSGDPKVRRAATVVLGYLGERATASLVKMLGDESAAVREAAADALGRTGGTPMLAPLVAALTDEDEAVRESAEGALEPMAEQALPMLLEAIRGQAPPETAAAVRLLAAVGPKAVDPLLPLLKDADWRTRWVAVQALGRLRDRRAVLPLIEALADPHFYVRKDAGEALEEIAGRRYGADAALWREWYAKEGKS